MTFTADDCLGVQYKLEDPLLILEDAEESMTKVNYPLIGFNGSSAIPRGKITLPVTIGKGQAARNVLGEFLVMDCDSVYNVIMGRTMIHKMQAIPSTHHQMMMYVSDAGFAERVRGVQEVARRTCHTAIRKPRLGDGSEDDEKQEPSCEEHEAKRRKAESGSLVKPAEVDARLESPSLEPDQEMEDVFLEDDSGRSVRIANIAGIDQKMICHKLDVSVEARPIKKKKRKYSSRNNKAIAEEVKKLQEAGFIEPCIYPKWLASVVMIKRANGSWRMCVDFTDLNRACPKDCYPLSVIDQLVDSTSGHALLSFLDAFSEYHEVFMHPDDKANTTFNTSA
ncbi:uncharacterized protein [Spinacia oleracea]|uniref:Reverse transcriptase domain-containing protein n=1 Tax=Spinacia oleracea TaxID=3562 RepID=A0ABM3QZE4_SPIOL|nr:uncharacterized protein LOC130463551 [Spinacia oleracea]